MSRPDPYRKVDPDAVSGEPQQQPGAGTARVESRITSGGTESHQGSEFRGNRSGEGEEGITDRAREAIHDARERASDLGERVGSVASRARQQVGDAFDRAEERLEEQTGAISLVREYPLAAVGLAFGLGFLMAGDTSSRSGVIGRTTGQLRQALLGGVTAMLMQELQDMMDEHGGPSGLLSSLTGRNEEG